MVPLKSLGYNGSNLLLGRSVASKLWVHEPDTFFGGKDKEISEKRNFFVNRSVPKKFSGTERFTKKFHFSLISLAASKKKVSGSCTHNFDATDLPNS